MPVQSVDHVLMPPRSVGPATGTTEINHPEEGMKAFVGIQTTAQTGILTDQGETEEEAAVDHPGEVHATTTTTKEEDQGMTEMDTRREINPTTALEARRGIKTTTGEERFSKLM